MVFNTQMTFFNQTPAVPDTEGIKYAGSKLKIIPYIISLIQNLKDIHSVLDGFSGTTRVSQAFAQLGYDTTANDISTWSEVFAQCYLIANKRTKYYQDLLDHLNNLHGYAGWFSQNYGGTEEDKKKPFQLKNTMKLDAIRDEIDKLQLSIPDKSVVLTSLILAMDRVDSTIGHYASYLSQWSKRSYNDMKLIVPRKFDITTNNNVIKDDIFNTIATKEYDLAYFDPPYGSNNDKMPPSRVRYNSYYHIWTSIILNDKPRLFGKANRRTDSRDTVNPSLFEEYKKDENGKFIAMKALDKLIKDTKARYIILSYSSGGRATKQDLMDILTTQGKTTKILEIDYKKNVMSNMCWTSEWINTDDEHKEYLFLLEKK